MKNKVLKIILLSIVLLQIFPVSAKADISKESYLTNKEYPFSECGGIAVDSEENIYLKNFTYHAIQVYDRKGNFKYSIDIPTEGEFYFKLNGNGSIEVAVERSDYLYTYDIKGFIIEEQPVDYTVKENYREKTITTFKLNGKVYSAINYLGYVYVLKNENGSFSTIFSIPFGIWLLTFLVIFLYTVMVIVGIILLARMLLRKGGIQLERKFRFISYYKYMMFKNHSYNNDYSRNHIEKHFRRREIIRHTFAYGILSVFLVLNIVFIYQTGGPFTCDTATLIRIITSFFVYALIDFVFILFRFNTSTFYDKASEV